MPFFSGDYYMLSQQENAMDLSAGLFRPVDAWIREVEAMDVEALA